jgi:anti-anti-sigma factor
VWLEGEHDLATVVVLADTLAEATAADDSDLIVDLSATFIGAATVDVLMRSLDFLRQKSRGLTLRSRSACARRVLDLCDLSDLVEPRPNSGGPIPQSTPTARPLSPSRGADDGQRVMLEIV